MNSLLNVIKWRVKDFFFNVKLLQWKSLFNYYFALLVGKKYVWVSVKGLKRSFLIRVKNRVDRNVLEYVFFRKYHLPPEEFNMPNNAVIVDLGSNIGCTLIDYHLRYPTATIFGYEMHPENYSIARQNCQQYETVSLFNYAVWTQKGSVAFDTANLTDAFAINNQLERGENVLHIPSLAIADIFEDNHISVVDYLKMDIEGAEIEIFNSNTDWLKKVHAMNIEFHNINTTQLEHYINLIAKYGFEVYKSKQHWLSIIAYRK